MTKAAGKLFGVFLSGGLADECTSGVNVGRDKSAQAHPRSFK